MLRIVFYACSLTLLSCIGKVTEKSKIKDYTLNYLSLGISFPPVSDIEQRNFTRLLLDELQVNQIRISEDWALREPTKGNFNWAPLDERINWAYTNNYHILLTIQSNGPDWACSSVNNNQSCVYNNSIDFKNYVEQLLIRYTGKIDKLQFGNEWQSEFWYAGNAQQFTEASNIVYTANQTYSPSTQFVLGGFTTISLRFLAGCNGISNSFYDDEGNLYDQHYLESNCSTVEIQKIKDRIKFVLENALFDILDIHLYDDVDQWDEYYFHFKSMVTKPIIVSEFGGPNVNIEPINETYQAQQIEKYILKLDSLMITEAYFFKLVEGTNNPAHAKSGLIERQSLNKKEGFEIFKYYSTNN